jgi:UDP:flavonoid glycosyltransferase YjiC (YdhE family)
VLPLFSSDQRFNADAVTRSGAGRTVGDATGDASLPDPFALAAAVPEALSALLDVPTYVEAARSLAAKIAELPSPADSARLFESLAAGS